MHMLGDGQDVRCARLRHRLGVTISPIARGAAISHTPHGVTVSPMSHGTIGPGHQSVAITPVSHDVSVSPLATIGTSPRVTTDSTPAEPPSKVNVVDDDACRPAEVHCTRNKWSTACVC